MTANRFQVGFLAVGLLVVLVAIGCSSDSDVISSGNIVATFPTSAVNPTATDYLCIRWSFENVKVKPTDGICSASSIPEFAGKPCGTDADCALGSTSCNIEFGLACDGGPNHNLPCTTSATCPGGSCEDQGECATFPGGSFTGAGCISDLDCTPGSSEKCAGRCSAGSSNPDGACKDAGDCGTGVCEGALAEDALGGNDLQLINNFDLAVAYFLPSCPACDLNLASPVLCDPADPVQCSNECVPGADVEPLVCTPPGGMCCELSELVAIPCETAADCPDNDCVNTAVGLPSSIFPEGKYQITNFQAGELQMFAPDALRDITACPGTEISIQYDPPLSFEVGPGRSNEIRFVIDVAELD